MKLKIRSALILDLSHYKQDPISLHQHGTLVPLDLPLQPFLILLTLLFPTAPTAPHSHLGLQSVLQTLSSLRPLRTGLRMFSRAATQFSALHSTVFLSSFRSRQKCLLLARRSLTTLVRNLPFNLYFKPLCRVSLQSKLIIICDYFGNSVCMLWMVLNPHFSRCFYHFCAIPPHFQQPATTILQEALP